jgi:hypothetical protein
MEQASIVASGTAARGSGTGARANLAEFGQVLHFNVCIRNRLLPCQR